jgi:hypothetical protein
VSDDKWLIEDVSDDVDQAFGPGEFLLVAGHSEVAAGMLASGPDDSLEDMRFAISLVLDCVEPVTGKRSKLTLIYPPELLVELADICTTKVPEVIRAASKLDEDSLAERTREAVARKLGANEG